MKTTFKAVVLAAAALAAPSMASAVTYDRAVVESRLIEFVDIVAPQADTFSHGHACDVGAGRVKGAAKRQIDDVADDMLGMGLHRNMTKAEAAYFCVAFFAKNHRVNDYGDSDAVAAYNEYMDKVMADLGPGSSSKRAVDRALNRHAKSFAQSVQLFLKVKK